MKTTQYLVTAVLAVLITGTGAATAAPVTFQNGTATFSQTCGATGTFSPDNSIDSDFSSTNEGWAVARACVSTASDTGPETAVWETGADFNATDLTFRLHQNFGSELMLGRFRLSITSDDRSTFADGFDTGGDVTANWTVLTAATVTLQAGTTSTILTDDSILIGGISQASGVYDVSFSGNFLAVTGVRLEVLADEFLPKLGPGRSPFNGNFVLTELELDASINTTEVVEPQTLALFGSGLLLLAAARRRRAVPQPA